MKQKSLVPTADYRVIFESTPDPLLILDREWRIVAVNDAYLVATMTKRDDIMGRMILDVFPDNPFQVGATATLRASLNRVVKSRSADVMALLRYDIPRPLPAGGFEERIWYTVNAPIFGADGELLYIMHRVQDLTEFIRSGNADWEFENLPHLRERIVAMQAEIFAKAQEVAEINATLKRVNEQLNEQNEKLHQSEERFASFMFHMPVAAWIKDAKGRYVYANAETERAFAKPLEAFLGKTDREMFPEETARQFGENDGRVLSEGESLQTVEVLRYGDGIEHYAIVNKFAIGGPDGTPAFVAGVALDITDRMRAELALKESEEKFSKVFQTVPVGITISTLVDGRFVEINGEGERLSGYRRDEVIGRTAAEFDIWKDHAERARMIGQVLKEGGVRDMEMSFKTRQGEVLKGLFSAVVVDIGGNGHLLSIVSDITERKRAETEIRRLNEDLVARAAELARANQELEAFNYTVAHDLRQPLNLIFGNCQAIKMHCGNKLDDDCVGFLDGAYRTVAKMDRLIETLLRFSQLSRVELKREQVDLSAMARSVADELKETAPERRVVFRVGEGIAVDGDPDLLRIVLDNLLGNAWKFTQGEGEAVITFGAIEVDGNTACFVCDNGPGFDAAAGPDPFAPFARMTTVGGHKGFGIGLATVERVVLRHGGRIWVETEPGKGACFYFTLS